MIKDMVDDFTFPDPDAEDRMPSFQFFHDAAVALGATCTHCAAKSRKTGRRKAFHRGDNRADVLARARARRFALEQELSRAVMDAEESA